MKAKLKLLKRLRDAREKIRDAAAMEVALRERERLSIEHERDRLDDLKCSIMNGAANRIAAAAAIGHIEQIGLEMAGAEQCKAALATQLEEAQRSADSAMQALKVRERELRLAEKLVSKERRLVEKEVGRLEQAETDDIVASRRKNEE